MSCTASCPTASARYDLDIAQTNIVGELLDVDAEVGLPPDLDPDETAEEIVRRYTALWHELTREETFGPDERFKLDERLHSLNDLGFDVEEIQLEATPSGYRLRLDPHVVEPGHHRHRLLRLTGLDAQENQARRMLNDIARYREALERREKRPIGEAVAASRWRHEVFEPTVARGAGEAVGRTSGSRGLPPGARASLVPLGEGGQGRRDRRGGALLRRARAADAAGRARHPRTSPIRTRDRAGGAMPPAQRSRAASLRGTPQRATLGDGRLAGAHRDPPCALRARSGLRGERGVVMNCIRGHCTSSHA